MGTVFAGIEMAALLRISFSLVLVMLFTVNCSDFDTTATTTTSSEDLTTVSSEGSFAITDGVGGGGGGGCEGVPGLGEGLCKCRKYQVLRKGKCVSRFIGM